MRGDRLRATGFWVQLVLLALVDWGTIAAILRCGGPLPALHVAGLVLVNLILLVATYHVWRWLRAARDEGS